MKKLYVSALAALLVTAAQAAAPAADAAAKPAADAKAAAPAKVEAAKPAADAKAAPAVAHKGGKKHRGRHGNTCVLADALNGDLKVWHMPTAEELKAEGETCKKACDHKAAHAHKDMKKHDSAAKADDKKAPEAAPVAGDKKPAAADEADAEENNNAA